MRSIQTTVRTIFTVFAALPLAAGCLFSPSPGYGKGPLGVTFSPPESRNFMPRNTFGVDGADAATFVPITTREPYFGKDKSRVFFGRAEIKGADPATFRVLAPDAYLTAAYSADKDSVFYEEFELRGANPATIDVSKAPFVTDGERVYYTYELMPGAKWPVQFVDRDLGIAADANGSFFVRKVKSGPGVSREQLLHMYYAPFAPCDPKTFPTRDGDRILTMDSQCAFHGTDRIPLTDRASFAFLGYDWSRDREGVFYRAERVAADPATAEIVYSASTRRDPGHSPGFFMLRDRNGCWKDAAQPVMPCPADARIL